MHLKVKPQYQLPAANLLEATEDPTSDMMQESVLNIQTLDPSQISHIKFKHGPQPQPTDKASIQASAEEVMMAMESVGTNLTLLPYKLFERCFTSAAQ